MYFEDFTNYSFLYYENTKNIGWLDKAYPYSKGKVSEEFIDKLWGYLGVSINRIRGFRNCSLCTTTYKGTSEATYKGEVIMLGYAEIRVLSEDGKNSYAAPDLIYHYILEHEYKPPEEFIQAVLKGPKPGSTEYDKFVSYYREYTLHGENIKNIIIAQRGVREDYIKITEEFHANIIRGNLPGIIELIDSAVEKITMIIDFSEWLYLAASEGKLEIVKYLISYGVKMDVSKPRNNPLFGAIYQGNADVVKLLIEGGIDITIKYSNELIRNKDALALAQEMGQAEIVHLLRSSI